MDSGAHSGRRPSLPAILGLADTGTSHVEKLVATAGGVVGILCVGVLSHAVLGGPGAVVMIASMGATATLLFAVPSGPLSQPWPQRHAKAHGALPLLQSLVRTPHVVFPLSPGDPLISRSFFAFPPQAQRSDDIDDTF